MYADAPEASRSKVRQDRWVTTLLVVVGCFLASDLNAAEPAAGGMRTPDKARQIFALNVGRTLGVKVSALEVNPLVETTEPYIALRTGELWAFEANSNKPRVVVRGFASAEGAVAFEHYQGGIGQPGGISALLRACRVLDKKRSLKTDAILTRMAWCLNNPIRGEMLYDAELLKRAGWTPRKEERRPRISLKNGGAEIVYFTMKQGLTGTFDIGKVVVTVTSDYAATIERLETSL